MRKRSRIPNRGAAVATYAITVSQSKRTDFESPLQAPHMNSAKRRTMGITTPPNHSRAVSTVSLVEGLQCGMRASISFVTVTGLETPDYAKSGCLRVFLFGVSPLITGLDAVQRK